MAPSETRSWLEKWEMDETRLSVVLLDDRYPPNRLEVWEADILDTETTDRFDFETIGTLTGALRTKEDGAPIPFSVRQERAYTSWGADAAIQQTILEVAGWMAGAAAAGVVGGTVYDALKAAVVKIAKAAQQRSEFVPNPLTREEAAARAQWFAISHFGLDDDAELDLVAEEHRPDGSRLFRFAYDDKQYEVEILDEEGLVKIGRIGWGGPAFTTGD